jgi:predicted RNase H-like HicB family nuclease
MPQRDFPPIAWRGLIRLGGMETSGTSERFIVAIHRTPAGYYARVLNLPGCLAKGASEVEALENVRVMIGTFIKVMRLVEQDKARVSVEISA